MRCADDVFLAVHTGNTSALNFYKKFGFEIRVHLKGYYYSDLQPPHAYLLSKKIVNKCIN